MSIQEGFFEVEEALVSRNNFLSFKSACAFHDRFGFGFVNGLEQRQVRLLRMKQSGTLEDYTHAFSSLSSQGKYMDGQSRVQLSSSGVMSNLHKAVFKEYLKKLQTATRLAWETYGTVHFCCLWILGRRPGMRRLSRRGRLRPLRRTL